jgi:hypothetical protein
VRKWGKKQVMLGNIDSLEEKRKKKNIVICGVEKKGSERKVATFEIVRKFLKEIMGLETLVSNTDHVERLSKKESQRHSAQNSRPLSNS